MNGKAIRVIDRAADLTDVTATGLALVRAANAAAARTTLELGSAALADTGDFDAAGTGATEAAAAVSAHVGESDPHAQYVLESAIGTTVQAYDATLAALAGQNWAANAVPVGSGADTVSQVAVAANRFLARGSTGNYVAKTISDTALSFLATSDGSSMLQILGVTPYGYSVVSQNSFADIRSVLELGSLATQSGTFSGTSSGTNTGDQTITLTGDVTGSGTGSFAATLTTVNANVGTFRSVTVNAKGLVTAATNPTTLAGYGITDAQPLDGTLTALAELTIAANTLTVGTGADTFAQTSFAANTFPARASTGSLSAKTITDFGLSLVDDADAAAARTTLGLVIGTNVQAYDADLTAWAGITPGAGVATLLGGASTGTGGPVGSTSPTLTTPNIGAATGTSLVLTNSGSLSNLVTQLNGGVGQTGDVLSATNGAGTALGGFSSLGAVAASHSTRTALTGNTNNWSGSVPIGVQRVSATTPCNLTGIVAPSGTNVNPAQFRWYINTGSNTITVTNEDANSTAANRFLTSTGGSLSWTQNRWLVTWYDVTDSRWRAALL